MSKFMKLEVEGKEYFIGFSNRASVLKAERKGFMKVLKEMDDAPVEGTAKILQLGLLEKQPDITLKECNEIINKYIEENSNDEETVDIGSISNFIIGQYTNFSGVPDGKRQIKEIPIVEM